MSGATGELFWLAFGGLFGRGGGPKLPFEEPPPGLAPWGLPLPGLAPPGLGSVNNGADPGI